MGWIAAGVGRARPIVKDVHLIVGIAALALMGAALVVGAWCWWRRLRAAWFWRVLRAAQVVVVVQVALGGVLLALGHKPGHLHVLYGLLPLVVSLLAEALRASAAQMVLDARGLESARAVGELPESEQQGIVEAILRRELAVMVLAALVVEVLLLRAAQTAG